jgi:hypothetical protein
MAATVHETIRLDTDLTGDLPTNQYDVRQGGLEEIYEPATLTERGLTGDLHVHRVMSGGAPLVFDNYQYTLLLTRAQKDALALDLGKNVYLMPHVRDEGDALNYRSIMHFKSMAEVKEINPMLDYFTATIMLEEATGGSV